MDRLIEQFKEGDEVFHSTPCGHELDGECPYMGTGTVIKNLSSSVLVKMSSGVNPGKEFYFRNSDLERFKPRELTPDNTITPCFEYMKQYIKQIKSL